MGMPAVNDVFYPKVTGNEGWAATKSLVQSEAPACCVMCDNCVTIAVALRLGWIMLDFLVLSWCRLLKLTFLLW